MSLPAVDRVLRRTDQDVFGCWLFRGCRDSNGYGNVREQGGRSTLKAHRVVYEHFKGPIPEGEELDHLCRVRHCVNPDHLDPVTRQEHVLRGFRNQHYGKIMCHKGHLLSGDGAYVDPRGGRTCAACNRERLRLRRRAKGIPPRPYQTRDSRERLYLEKVPLVREALASGESQRSIAARLGISRKIVQKVQHNRLPKVTFGQ